ncbi:MAG: HAMP domain-containing protein [Desulfovermiculus sp.]|nr:HAMP domain-containing protein [Desulfovermiculus sp.]
MTFRHRIFISFSLLLLGALILAYVVLSKVLYQEISGQAYTNGQRYLKHIEWLVNQELQITDADKLQQVLKGIGQRLNLRVTYIDTSGRVLADSGVSTEAVAAMENHAQRPEIKEAMQAGTGRSIRYSSTLQTSFLYVALRIEPITGSGPAVLRVAMPTAQLQSGLDGIKGQLALFLTGLLILAGLLSWLISRRLGVEIKALSRTAEAIGSGDLEQRIEKAPGRDFQPLVQSINRMAKRLQSTLHEVSVRRDELETLLNGMHEGVFVLDFQGKVRLANKALHQLAGISGSILNREPIEFLRSPELQDACFRALHKEGKESEHVFLHLPGNRFVEATIIPVKFKTQEERQLIAVLHEVTELKRAEQVRKDFVANVSHELRTPLTAIKGYAESLASTSRQDDTHNNTFLQVIIRNANQMNHILDNLLQLARLETNGVSRSETVVDVHAALTRAWEICAPLAEEKEIRLDTQFEAQTVWVKADADQLVQVWVNLLDNALKYSPAQSWIKARAQRGQNEWVLALEDNGPGIESGQQERIFERFYRGRSAREESVVAGSGLGLAISRHLLANNKGRIWVQSPAPDTLQGSVFYFSLPIGER